MKKEIPIDRAVYLVDRDTKTYHFLRRNPNWRSLNPEENLRNRASIKGFTRTFRDGRTKIFKG
jgi:hypothetical protein